MIVDDIGHPAPYLSTPGCAVCFQPDTATADLYNGRRCGRCAPRYDPQTAVNILMAGWPGTAAAYVRALNQPAAAAPTPRSASGPRSDPAEWYERAHLDHP